MSDSSTNILEFKFIHGYHAINKLLPYQKINPLAHNLRCHAAGVEHRVIGLWPGRTVGGDFVIHPGAMVIGKELRFITESVEITYDAPTTSTWFDIWASPSEEPPGMVFQALSAGHGRRMGTTTNPFTVGEMVASIRWVQEASGPAQWRSYRGDKIVGWEVVQGNNTTVVEARDPDYYFGRNYDFGVIPVGFADIIGRTASSHPGGIDGFETAWASSYKNYVKFNNYYLESGWRTFRLRCFTSGSFSSSSFYGMLFVAWGGYGPFPKNIGES